METKKNPKADLEKRRTMMFQIGLIVSLGLILMAFEWKTPDYGGIKLPPPASCNIPEDISVILTKQEAKPPKPMNATLMRITDNENQQTIDLIIDAGIDPGEVIPPFVAPVITDEVPEETDEPFVIVENMPAFPGGDAALMQYLLSNTKYPHMARESGISGTVYITFVVEKDGSLSDIRALREVGGGCTSEALRVVQAMPRWIPGKQRGVPVRVRINLPVKFKLI